MPNIKSPTTVRPNTRLLGRNQKSPLTAGDTLAQVRDIVLETLAACDARVYLFGSWARGCAHSLSDIDVAIEPHASLPPGLLACMRERLEESSIPYRVEVVDISNADPSFRERVLQEGISWND